MHRDGFSTVEDGESVKNSYSITENTFPEGFFFCFLQQGFPLLENFAPVRKSNPCKK